MQAGHGDIEHDGLAMGLKKPRSKKRRPFRPPFFDRMRASGSLPNWSII